MNLATLTHGLEIVSLRGDLSQPIRGLHYDSRQIAPGQAFVAIRGYQSDGNRFAGMARERGATAIISELAPPENWTTAWVQVRDARRALAQAAANWYGHPSRRVECVGLTGTNGKTTTAFLVESILRQDGRNTGLLGTIEYHLGERVIASPHTTPESLDLQAFLAEVAKLAAEGGRAAAVMEVSSHALALDRAWACRFAAAVFTNLTRDHLDFHGSFEAYAAAKRRLFEGTGDGPPRFAIVNADDPAGATMLAGFRGPAIRYGLSPGADFRALDYRLHAAGLEIEIQAQRPRPAQFCLHSSLAGRVNVSNILAAAAAAYALGVAPETIAAGVAALPRVRGRFERVLAGQPFQVVVDYAHTPDALRNLLGLARELLRSQARPGRLLCAFGCGGDRDRGKRPQMGKIAGEACDVVVVTSDNPRHEPPEAILAEIEAGMAGTPARRRREPDRRAAICGLLREARPGDLVVIAGKGHETEQIIGDRHLPFDDTEVARAELEKMGWPARRRETSRPG